MNILKQNKVPIVSPLGLDKNNQTYNVNGDTAAMAIAKSLKARRLLLMTNVDGVIDKQKKIIEELSSSEILEMIKNETITEGMIPKILSLIHISEPTRRRGISYAVFCLKKKRALKVFRYTQKIII